MISVLCKDENATIRLGEQVGSCLQDGDVIAFKGSLAAGKTCMTRGIAKALGIEETVSSPTYTIISEYTGPIPLHHVDVYRLSGDEDFFELGSEELMNGPGVTIIEWSERLSASLPQTAISIELEVLQDNSRKIDITDSRLEEQLHERFGL